MPAQSLDGPPLFTPSAPHADLVVVAQSLLGSRIYSTGHQRILGSRIPLGSTGGTRWICHRLLDCLSNSLALPIAIVITIKGGRDCKAIGVPQAQEAAISTFPT